MIEPEAEIAAAITDSGRVGVLATPATVSGRRLPARARPPAPRAHGHPGRGAGPRGDHPARLPVLRGGGRDGALLLRAAAARPGRHGDPRLHPLPARPPDAAALPRPRGAPGDRRPRARGDGAADPRGAPARDRRDRSDEGTYSVRLHRRSRRPSASSGPGSSSCRSATSSCVEVVVGAGRWLPLWRRGDPRTGSGRYAHRDEGRRTRARVGALRMLADALQKDLKDGGDDEVAVLRRERKRRLEAAAAYRDGRQRGPRRGRGGRGARDRALPAGRALRRRAAARRRGRIAETGASAPGRHGQGDGRRDAEGRRARRRQAGQRGGSRKARRIAVGPPPADPRQHGRRRARGLRGHRPPRARGSARLRAVPARERAHPRRRRRRRPPRGDDGRRARRPGRARPRPRAGDDRHGHRRDRRRRRSRRRSSRT